jgi:hypothetical protein
MKSLWYWERHDVVNYLRVNFLETGSEFTTETLIKKIGKLGKNDYFFGYGEKIISQHLFELSKEGYLSVRYISIEMKPNNSFNTVTNSDNCKHRFGSKTLSVYRIKNEYIDNATH